MEVNIELTVLVLALIALSIASSVLGGMYSTRYIESKRKPDRNLSILMVVLSITTICLALVVVGALL